MVEIVADADRPILARFSNGTESKLAASMDIAAAVKKLSSVSIAPDTALWQRFAYTPRPKGVLCCNVNSILKW